MANRMDRRRKFTADQVGELDARRQHQITNQIGTINRLLEGDSSYDQEMKTLHEALATVQAERDALQKRLDESEAELAAHQAARS